MLIKNGFMSKVFCTIIIVFWFYNANSQVNKTGYPFYSYYNSEHYNSEDQNWSIVQENNGLVFIANNSGVVLHFDGQKWRKIFTTNASIRALGVSDNGLIFLGGLNKFGCLRPNLKGNLEYNSLVNTLDTTISGFFIQKIYIIGDDVYFSAEEDLLFKYNQLKDTTFIIKLPSHTLFTFPVNKTVYGSSYNKGIFHLDGDSIISSKSDAFFTYKDIFSIISDSSNCYIVTGKKGIYKYNFENEINNILLPNAQNILKHSIIYSASKKGNEIVLGTLYGENGIVGISTNGDLKYLFDSQIGIKDHLVTSVSHWQNSLWASLNIGVSHVEINNPIRFFGEESSLKGYINDIFVFNSTLYLGTDLGVYYLVYSDIDKPIFKKVLGIEGQVYKLVKHTSQSNEEFLLAGSTKGIFQIDNKFKKAVNIDEELQFKSKVLKDRGKKDEIKKTRFYVKTLLSDSNGVWVVKKDYIFQIKYKQGAWFITDNIFKLESKTQGIVKDFNNDIWYSIANHGIMKIEQTENNSTLKKFGVKDGLPHLNDYTIYNYNKGLLVTSDSGIFNFNFELNMFYRDTLFPDKFTNGTYIFNKFFQISDSTVVLNYMHNDSAKIDYLNIVDGKYKILNNHFNRLGNVHVERFFRQENILWFGISNKLYSYQLDNHFNPNTSFKCLVRKVEGIDTVYFRGAFYKETTRGIMPSDIQNEKQKPIIDYSANDMTFHYAAPYFEGVEAIKYSYKLEGFKDEWSKWNSEPKAVFTNLNVGQYTFKVKAINIYEVESEIGTYEFTILPPWYRTIIAYIIYVILIIIFLIIVVKLYTRKLEKEKIALEGIVRERTAEIREQRDEIAGQKQSIEDSILYARRIQRAILPSDELANDILPEHFILFRPRDVVSGDYFWMNKIGNKVVIVAADCTGHGVPGAFMSMLGVSFLNEIVLKENTIEPHFILNKLRARVKKTLKQEGKEGEAKDGMDVALVMIDYDAKKLYFSGAYNPLYIYRDGELNEVKADRMPIGIYIKEKDSFTLNEYDYQPGDTFYIFSDGYPDQFGGPKNQKFRTKAMKQLLSDLQPKPMAEQHEILNTTIENWMAESEGQDQIDDMVIIGVRM